MPETLHFTPEDQNLRPGEAPPPFDAEGSPTHPELVELEKKAEVLLQSLGETALSGSQLIELALGAEHSTQGGLSDAALEVVMRGSMGGI